MCKVFVRSENFTNDCYFLRYEYVFNSERLFTKAKGIGSMDDREIIELYWERSDNAIAQAPTELLSSAGVEMSSLRN